MVVVATTVLLSAATLAEVLELSARYVADYQESLSSVVAEESYEQRVESKSSGSFAPFGGPSGTRRDRQRRRLKSDYLLVKSPGGSGWLPFRDVYEVDGKAVRDREERLSALFLDASPAAREQAVTIAEESSRFNIGSVRRTVNAPTLALIFLSEVSQPRFEFRQEGTDGDTWEIAYREQARPTMIRGQADADLPVFGTFWIDARDGRVLRSRLRTEDRYLRSVIDVTYELDAELGLLVPIEMQEEYRTDDETVEGAATYGQFRQFNVRTAERIR